MKLKFICNSIERLNNLLGKLSSFLLFSLVLLVSFSVILRYIFSIGFTWLQDLYIWIHACSILLGIAYTLNKDNHVRIDIVFRNLTLGKRKKINLFGSIFFGLPFSLLLISKGYEYYHRSFLLGENSKETGGLPNIFILKFFIFFMGILLFFELINKILKFISKND
jgi:TRAP-type mannitol/chloroaromatic compound transport system permease small subunit